MRIFGGSSAKDFLKEPGGGEFALNQIEQIVDAQFVPLIRYGPGDPAAHHVASLILSQFATTTWPIVGNALLREDAFMLSDLLGVRSTYSFAKPGDLEREEFACVLWSVPANVLIPWCHLHPGVVGHILEFIGLFITQDDGSFRWQPSALALIEDFYRDDFSNMILSSLFSFGSTGSRVPYVERRINLVKQLSSNSNPSVRSMSDELVKHLESQVQMEQKHDEEFNAGIPWRSPGHRHPWHR